jgi:hypothetical protein
LLFFDNYRTYYNFVRLHQALEGKTPAQEAEIDASKNPNKWMELIEKAKNQPIHEKFSQKFLGSRKSDRIYYYNKKHWEYSITLGRIFGGLANGSALSADRFWDESGMPHYLSEITIMPGKEICFGEIARSCPERRTYFKDTSVGVVTTTYIGSSTYCASDGRGTDISQGFGFEYNETIAGKTISKREVGEKLVAKCTGPS